MDQDKLLTIYHYLNVQENKPVSPLGIAEATGLSVKEVTRYREMLPHLFLESSEASLFSLNSIVWSEGSPEDVVSKYLSQHRKDRILGSTIAVVAFLSFVSTMAIMIF